MTEVDGRVIHREARPKTIKGTSTEVYVSQPDRVQLDLSIEEAVTLRIILNYVGGLPAGRCGDASAITEALEPITGSQHFHPDVTTVHSIHFRDTRSDKYPYTDTGTQTTSQKDNQLKGSCATAPAGTSDGGYGSVPYKTQISPLYR